MFKHSEKNQFINNTLGTREKYHKMITSHSFTDFEKDILLQASANIKSSDIDQSLIDVAYDILISKSLQNNTQKKNSTINLSLLKYLLPIGLLFVLFYIITLKEPEVAKKLETLKQTTALIRFGDVTGQGFLRTKGGSVRTCAGNTVYIEKSNPNGFLILNEKWTSKKEEIKRAESSLQQYREWLTNSKINLASYSSSTYLKSFVAGAKKTILSDKKRISQQKEYISSLKKEFSILEEKVKNSIKDNILKTMCDVQGNFEFTKVGVGKYYIRTVVQWYVGDEKQGGIISKAITIKEGKNKIMLTE